MTTFQDLLKLKTKKGVPYKITSIEKIKDTKKWHKKKKDYTYSWEIITKFDGNIRFKLTLNNNDIITNQEKL